MRVAKETTQMCLHSCSWYLEPNLGIPDTEWPDQPGTKAGSASARLTPLGTLRLVSIAVDLSADARGWA